MAYDLLTGDSTAQQQVKEPQRLMRDAGDVEQLVREHGDIKPYIDPVLSSSRRHYVAFCRRMLKIGFCRRMEEVVGMFFVWEKKGRLKMRVILDARRTNRRFLPSPPFSLMTAEGFAGMSTDGDGGGEAYDALSSEFALAVTDVQNCFHYLKIGER